MGLLLKQLEINGFKSFATPTTFFFDRGITAIVGPNGSGKSNVAEALRWVLGEQGHANLRSRRTEDVIFAGSDKRAQQSLAEVTLTLDNNDGSLPVAFAEVTVARRAFRTGESQYLINGGRVRLKDVHQLVAPLGQAYTIIGQGLVDAALSQRPEERRGLFEHAAGISGLRLRANDAERGLVETAGNAQRLRDILGELEPRVRSLERSARLAREYGAVRDRLRSAQRLQYAHQWSLVTVRLREAMHALQETERANSALIATNRQSTERLGKLRGSERQLSARITKAEEVVREHEQALIEARHRRELLDARERSSSERLADLRATLRQIEQDRAEAAENIATQLDEVERLARQVEMLQGAVAEREAVVAATLARRESMQQELLRLEQEVIDLTRGIATLEGQITALSDREAQLAQEHQQLADSASKAVAQQAELHRQIERHNETVSSHEAHVDQLTNDLSSLQQRIEAAEQASRDTAAQREHSQRELTALRERLEALERTHLSGEGFYAGVRAVLRAVNQGALHLPGLVGVLAESIDVPGQYEMAIEVALGGHLQDIVVRNWSDAQSAIAFLKQRSAGRATFQPLDTLQPSPGRRVAFRDAGLVGIAATLVTCTPEVQIVVDQILGRTLVATDLDASRRLVRHGGGWTIVSLSGEITRPGGSVTGGARTAEAGLLARERERRTLPASIASVEVHLAELAQRQKSFDDQLQDLRSTRQSDDIRLRDQQQRLTAARTELERAEREVVSHQSALCAGNRRLAAIADRMSAAQDSARMAQASVAERRALHEDRILAATALRVELQSISNTTSDEDAQLRAELAGTRERLKAASAGHEQLLQRISHLDAALARRTAEVERLVEDKREAVAERDEISRSIDEYQQELDSLQAALPPLRSERAALATAVASAERGLDQSIGQLRDGERELDRATLQVARAQDERVFLVERIRNDLELDDPDELGSVEIQESEIPDEREIARLRERLRRMAVVGADAVEQYESEAERLGFLTHQLQDVDDAALGLRKVLDELNGQMTTRFSATFRDVAAAFEQTFSRLFGGGSARLVFSEDDGGSHGIDIVAQPPGKRLQNLNALSGGERALTAVALLIAIQRVNPSPFCLLDEVDAALDESNVLRFRDEIRELSQTTQFVLITHNRGTIEGADTLYGVTMGEDGISRVLSLKLADAIAAVDEYDTVGPF